MTEKDCPTDLEAAARAYYDTLGGEKYVNTPSGALKDENFSRMVDFSNRVSAAVQAAGTGADVGKIAQEVFAELYPQGQYKPLSNGAEADWGFSMQNEFANNLSAHLGAARMCEELKR